VWALFIYIGTVIVKFGIKIVEDEVRTLINWKSRVSSNTTLKESGLSAFNEISKNIKDLYAHGV